MSWKPADWAEAVPASMAQARAAHAIFDLTITHSPDWVRASPNPGRETIHRLVDLSRCVMEPRRLLALICAPERTTYRPQHDRLCGSVHGHGHRFVRCVVLGVGVVFFGVVGVFCFV